MQAPQADDKNIKFIITKFVFFSISKCIKTRLRAGSAPVPAMGAYDDPPDHLVGW